MRSPICLRRDGCDGVMISVPPPISRFPGSGVSAGGTESPYLDTPPEKGRRALPLKRRDAENAFTGPSLPPPRRSSGWAPFRRVARAAPPGVRWGSVHRRPSPPPPGRAVPPFLPGAPRFSRRHAIYYEWSTTFSQRYDGNTTCARYRTLRHVTRGYVVPSKDYSRPPEEERRARRVAADTQG